MKTLYRSLIVVLTLAILLASCTSLPAVPVFPTRPLATPTSTASSQPTIPSPTLPRPPADTPTPVTTLPSASSTLTIDPAKLRGQTIRLWYVVSPNASLPGGMDPVLLTVEAFQKNNPYHLQVESTSFNSPDLLLERLQATLTDVPDLLMLLPYQAARLDSTGQRLVDLTPYVSDPEWGLPPAQSEAFIPSFWRQDLLKGKRIGIPAALAPEVLLYNQTWATELGYSSAPVTAQEFRAQACAASRSSSSSAQPTQPGGWAIDTNPSVMLSWLYAFGSDVVSAAGQGYQLDTAQVSQTLTFLRQLYDDGCAWQPEAVPPIREFAARQSLFISLNLSGLPAVENAFAQAHNSDHWTVLAYPSPLGKPALAASSPAWTIIRSQPERQVAAWLLLKALIEPSSLARQVQASFTWPPAASVDPLLASFQTSQPVWAASLQLQNQAHPEPALASWGAVRWVLADAGAQLFSPVVSLQQVPELVKTLDDTAQEIGDLNK